MHWYVWRVFSLHVNQTNVIQRLEIRIKLGH